VYQELLTVQFWSTKTTASITLPNYKFQCEPHKALSTNKKGFPFGLSRLPPQCLSLINACASAASCTAPAVRRKHVRLHRSNRSLKSPKEY
jgi:hypothetical protein